VSFLLTLLIAVIELTWTSKIKRLPPIRLNILIYLVILFVGNSFAGIAAWRMAHTVIQPSATSSASPTEPGGAKSKSSEGPLLTAPDSGDLPKEAFVLLAAALGVFGFQGIIQKVNISIWDRGVLTLDDWISKARDNAIASAVEADAKKEHKEFVKLATVLKAMPVKGLNSLVVDLLGEGKVAELEARAQKEQAEPQALKAYALVRNARSSAEAYLDRTPPAEDT
jgi:hypothetical protein